jgi:outer membrane protein OmpA-like peptidoglycan-associated protein
MRILFRGRVLLVSACSLAAAAGWAQQSQKPVQPAAVTTDLAVTFAVERAQAVSNQKFWFKGGGADAAVTFWKGLGLAATLTGDQASNVADGVDVNKLSYLGGPRYTFTAWKAQKGPRRLQVYGQGLFGGVHGFDGLYPADGEAKTSANSFAIQAGGGLNLYLTKRWGVRLLEADYVRSNLPNASDDVQNDLRLAFGVTYHLESAVLPPVTLSVTASPAAVFAGDPVTVTATAGNLNPKQNVIYSFSGEGVTSNGATATVATSTLAPGTYTVKAQVKEGKAGKEGLKPWQTASASASFTVKQFEPPTISCSANPSTLKPGESSTVTCNGVSPQNRPLTCSYTASAGTVSGSGATASFSSTGAPTGTVAVSGTVTDDKGQTSTSTANLIIMAPYIAPAPHTQALCSIGFSKDKSRPTRVDNEAKACLDEVALDLQKQSDAKVVVVGNSNAAEKAKLAKQQAALKHKHLKVVDPAAERAANTKDYLVAEKGIDAARVSIATGATDDQKVENYLVPSGAAFASDVAETTAVDESTVKAQPRKALGKHHARKATAETQTK